MAVQPRTAIYTIYPVAGLQPSHLDALKALCAADFSTVVVSNQFLHETERASLAALSAIVIERPNFGYDFGAYREGILTLRKEELSVSELVLLNDSVWFPVGPYDWLNAATTSACNLVGAVSNCGVRLLPIGGEALFAWDYDTNQPNFHYCSFALRFDASILADAGFWAFWQRFRLTNDKLSTIHRGEIGLSRWLLKQGYSHEETFPVAGLARILGTKDFNALLSIAEELVIPEDAVLRAQQRAILHSLSDGTFPSQDEATEHLLAFILEAVAKTGPAYALPSLAVAELQFPFLKKSPIWLDESGRRITLNLLTHLGLDEYASEARALHELKVSSRLGSHDQFARDSDCEL